MLINTENIVSITEANRSFTKVAKMAREKNEPVIVMKNNKPDLVIMDYELYKDCKIHLSKKAPMKVAEEIMDEYSDVFEELAKEQRQGCH